MHARTCPPKNQGDRTSRPSLWGEPTFLWNLPDGKRKKKRRSLGALKRQNRRTRTSGSLSPRQLGRGAAPSKPPPALWKVHKEPKNARNHTMSGRVYSGSSRHISLRGRHL